MMWDRVEFGRENASDTVAIHDVFAKSLRRGAGDNRVVSSRAAKDANGFGDKERVRCGVHSN